MENWIIGWGIFMALWFWLMAGWWFAHHNKHFQLAIGLSLMAIICALIAVVFPVLNIVGALD